MSKQQQQHSVLFVCLGNICRSPMAEAIFHHLATQKGVRDKWIIDSAGTGGHEAGNPIYSSAERTLNKHGITYEHIARKITQQDFEKFDFILGFDNENIKNIERMKPKNSKSEIRLLNYYHPSKKNKIIADPWWSDTPQMFEEVYQDCYESCQALLDSV